jgi:hypothetical protein
MRICRLLLLTSFYSLAVFCQEPGRNTVTIGVGVGVPTGGEETYITSVLPDSAAFSASYEYRLFKYFAPEVSVVNLIPAIQNYDPHQQFPPDRVRVTLLSFGGRGIAPLRQGRTEIFAGAAAVYVSTSDPELLGYGSTSWLWQINGGGRFAIDRHKHFWIGPTARFSRDAGRPTQEWISLTGDFGFRF